ncbi:MAG: DUF364 domain-containing protein [Anaerolineae bacterium]|nr:DUF364 domain-containing protein [Anaerolineae bacterium]
MVHILDALIAQTTAKAARVTCTDIVVGSHWTMVEVAEEGSRCAGLAASLQDSSNHHHDAGYPVRHAGALLTYPVVELLNLVLSDHMVEVSIGFATLNALLDVDKRLCQELNAFDLIVERGSGYNIAVVGHFPFVPRLKSVAKQLWVLERDPHGDDLPASEAPDILPKADVVAITGTSLANGTFDGLLALCKPGAFIVVLGATTPLSPILLGVGVSAIAGTLVEDPVAVKLAVSQGATFRQIKGKRLVTMMHD